MGHGKEARVPRRRVCAPLDTQRHLVAGHPALPREARERLRRLELDTPSAPTVFELAWYACDGARSLSAIADLVEIESGVQCGAAIAEWFEWTVLVGLSEWATSPSELLKNMGPAGDGMRSGDPSCYTRAPDGREARVPNRN
jgi:hypothetical protein